MPSPDDSEKVRFCSRKETFCVGLAVEVCN
jgi:hypothetical protein